jgi:hypothetical protein
MRLAPFLVVLALVWPATFPAFGEAQGEGGTAGPGPDLPVTRADVRAALEAARPEMEACLEGGPNRGTVRVRLDGDAALTFTLRTRPRDRRVERCVETAARRYLTPLIYRPVPRPVSAHVSLRRPTPRIAPAEPAPL